MLEDLQTSKNLGGLGATKAPTSPTFSQASGKSPALWRICEEVLAIVHVIREGEDVPVMKRVF